MIMLREMNAFEACWLDLKDIYPTSQADNTLIAQAMGQLVDQYKKPAQVEQDLPDHLRILFRRLALAYFQGYVLRSKPVSVIKPRPIVTAPSCPVTPERRQLAISDAVAQVRALAEKAQQRMVASGQCQAEFCDMETLVVEFPENWQPDGQP